MTPGANAEWYGLNQYLFYEINCCWKAGIRYEWFRDDDGARVVPTDPVNPNRGPFVGNFQAVTIGANWTPNDNLTVRPEVRWDWFGATAPGLTRPFDDGAKNSQFTIGIDAIYLW